MPYVQQIETTVGENNLFPGAPPFVHLLAQFFPAERFVSQCVQWGLVMGGAWSKACNSSCRETVAVPRFITTIPPA